MCCTADEPFVCCPLEAQLSVAGESVADVDDDRRSPLSLNCCAILHAAHIAPPVRPPDAPVLLLVLSQFW